MPVITCHRNCNVVYLCVVFYSECVVLLRDRLGIKSHVNKSKQTEPKQSASAFFKGLFSRKRESDKKRDTPQTETRLPAVSSNKTDQLTGRNSLGINGSDNNLNIHGSVKKEMVDVNNGNISHREQQIVTPREGGSKKKKRQGREERDAGVSTPTTLKSMSSWVTYIVSSFIIQLSKNKRKNNTNYDDERTGLLSVNYK